MGWSIGYDKTWNRDIGYGVPAQCDQPGCANEIDRGLSYVCGGEPYGGDAGCGLYFCGSHMELGGRDVQVCGRCLSGGDPFAASGDVPQWIDWKLTDDSWAAWRAEHPDEVRAMRTRVS